MASPIPDKLIQTLVVPNCGALFLAVPFASLVYGITVLQTYRYYSHYADDPLYVKIFVAVIAFFDTAQLAFVIYSAWWYLIPNYGNLASISVIPFGISAEIAMTIALGILVQCFFASRVWLMSGRKLIIPLIIHSPWGNSHSGFTTPSECKELGNMYTILSSFSQCAAFAAFHAVISQRFALQWSAAVGLACSMASDFAITGSQCYYLRKVRSGMTKTDKLIDVLIMYTVNTGLITSVVATSAIVLSTVFSTTFWLVIPFTLISKSYANSALAT
ncbi:hypothetical protein OBBRIDRAFT_836233 [Obba rivulosa]|uniref:DUF6534 domain-containing protein n=1 Tax=Obba rivulosa TaxID=1052685 RepID=A0A8E2DJD3_9APHY|nr:hypothetical protein OBBRIDRAFT_836233 [Obba rivulosa]